MEDLRKYTRKSELYKLSAEEQTEKMKLVMKEVEKVTSSPTYRGGGFPTSASLVLVR